jgi:predicted glycogen debranching enzyme
MLLRYVGDRIRFTLKSEPAAPQAFLRTNLGRGSFLQAEIVQEYREELSKWDLPAIQGASTTLPHGMAWRDIPLRWKDGEWSTELALTEVGFFNAKAYVVDEHGRHIWPGGPNTGITVHPNESRTGNVVYCAFTRMFGETKTAVSTVQPVNPLIERLDKQRYAVIPPSGKFRDLVREFPHIFETLGCRILHLLPVNPTPTTYARFGRFGSPYACEDLTMIDPALVEFDRRTTAIDQFRELTYAAHSRDGRVFLDIVINHTGWGSTLQENHPEWFLRKENGVFVSPGAWGTTWEDLVELDHRMPLSWDYLAEVFVTWCRRGVDGFRCDAGYKVPTAAWRYIIAKVRHEFPNALFLLEGLGGAWAATEDLLTRGGMQWAYSELFQNYSPVQVSGYLDHSIRKSETVGTLTHYSETHDNARLAAQGTSGAKGRAWSLLRNQLCALASHSGSFAYTCGVEWLATEKIDVHSCRGMAWENSENIVPELTRLSELLREHPCFFDGAVVRRISSTESPVLALSRVSAESPDRVLVLINLDAAEANSVFLPKKTYAELGQPDFDLLGEKPLPTLVRGENVEFRLEAGQSVCLSSARTLGTAGGEYRRLRAVHGWAIAALSSVLEPEEIGAHAWRELAEFVEKNPKGFLASLGAISREEAMTALLPALKTAAGAPIFPQVIEWSLIDRKRVTPLPPKHWLLIKENAPFRATLTCGLHQEHCASVAIDGTQWAFFAPIDAFKRPRAGRATLHLERFGPDPRECEGEIVFLKPRPDYAESFLLPLQPKGSDFESPTVLLTNGRGGMAHMCVDLGEVKSKYDCVLGANLHPSLPVDRHIFVKRIRVWANADRFITPLNSLNLQVFSAGPPARWEFAAIAGDGQFARIEIMADMLEGKNATLFSVRLLDTSKPGTVVRLTVRFDLEDRNFHAQTQHNGGAEYHFTTNSRVLENHGGFEFRPSKDRHVRVSATGGHYYEAPEWSDNVGHPVERTRGQVGAGDAYSPGWFDIPLPRGVPAKVLVSAEAENPALPVDFAAEREKLRAKAYERAGLNDSFGRQLAFATQAYVVRRDQYKTIIAGYPWFLDWGRDSLICARGLISAGMLEEVQELLVVFGRFEKDGTLPNTIHGEDASNRDTSDAPLWYGVVCEELAAVVGPAIYETKVDAGGRTIRDVLRGIAVGYARGTPNRIHMDEASGLIWSPSHFTWMDTNYPAGTPREGYPVEIQALWIKLLRQLDRLGVSWENKSWAEMADRATTALPQLFWLEEKGWLADVLLAPDGTPAANAVPDDALRSNCVIPLTFDLIPKTQARRCLENVLRYLVVPGALRSLAPLPVKNPLPIHASDWRLLNSPNEPYWGRYEGDEDTQRKPAYHNGTAWTWTFPGVAEAIARAWDFGAEAVDAAKAYVGNMEKLLNEGCIGQIPEILDGDAPHLERGCDAQAWGVTEALRVWKLLTDS